MTKKNFFNHLGAPKIQINQKFLILKKVTKKSGETQKKKKIECDIQITIFLHSLGCNLSDCILSLFGKILEQEIFQVKVRTLTFAWAGPVPGPKAIGQ